VPSLIVQPLIENAPSLHELAESQVKTRTALRRRPADSQSAETLRATKTSGRNAAAHALFDRLRFAQHLPLSASFTKV
jgi:hypothetical protein